MGVDVEPYEYLKSLVRESESARSLVDAVEQGVISPDSAVNLVLSLALEIPKPVPKNLAVKFHAPVPVIISLI